MEWGVRFWRDGSSRQARGSHVARAGEPEDDSGGGNVWGMRQMC